MQDATNDIAFGRSSSSEDETLPERKPEARETHRLGRGLVVTHLITDIGDKLRAQPDSKARRALMRKLESLAFVVQCWGAMPPRPEQVSAMLEMLLRVKEATDDGPSLWAK